MLKSGKNVGAESAIPHMVITSAEGEDEEIKVGDVSSVSATQETIQNGSEVKHKPEEDVDRQSAMQRPLIISSSETSKTDIPSSTDETSSHVPESSTQSADQRPLVISGGRSTTPAKPVESIYEVIEPKERVPEQVNGVNDALSDTEPSQHDGKSLHRRKEEQRTTTTPEIPKDSDGFFAKSKAFFKEDIKPHFSFPKFAFGGKEHKKTLKDTTSSSEQSSSKLEKEDKRSEKTQEYSIEAAEASSYIDHAMEHYRKIDTDATVPLSQSTTECDMNSDASKSFDTPSSRSPVLKSDSQSLKTELPPLKSSTQIMGTQADSGNIQLAPEEPCELFVKEGKTPKSTLTKKQSKDGKKVGTGKRASTPESLYDTCCIRLAVLLRNKALEIATDKVVPPKKPPKPSAEAVAKARAEIASKKLKEYECQFHPFGDDFHVGFEGLRYADEDTESSTDYKDLENFGVVANPECYGIIRKMKDEKSNEFRAPSSTCSGMSSYYTADTVTLKDENSSDNTLETVSLGSYESVVCKPQSEQPSFSSSSSFFISSKEKLPTSQPSTLKKVPPPVPPKPTVLPDTYKNLKTFPDSKSSDVSRCVNTLSLSPRPVLRSTGSPGGIKRRPLTIAGIKETDFSDYSKKTFSTLPHKPVLNTVVRNTSLKTLRNLPAEPMKYQTMKPLGVSKSLPLESSSRDAESTNVSVPLKPPPPPRPPPPTITPSSSAATLTNTQVVSNELVPTEEVIPPPRRGLIKHHVSPPRPVPPAKKPALAAKPASIPPPRPPPPVPRLHGLPSSDNILDNSTIVNCPEPVVSQEDQKLSGTSEIQPTEAAVSETKLRIEDVDETAVPNEESCEFKHPSEEFIPSSVQSNEKSELESKSIEESNIVSRHSPVVCDDNTVHNLKEIDSVENRAMLPPPRLKAPRPPPRGRRKRSRTVEVVSVTKESPETRKRSQSLTDIDVEKRIAALEAPAPEKPDLKSLYTTVNKDPFRTKNSLLDIDVDHGRRSPSTDSMSGRPLPPPPPPPRSKSHSAGRRSKSDERPSSSATHLSSSTSSITKAESMPSEINGGSPSIKPPVRKNKESKKMFFSLRSKGKEKKVDADKKFHTVEKIKPISNGYDVPIKPGRRIKPPPPQPVIQYDENANVAIPVPDTTITSNIESTPPPPLPARQRGVSMNCDKTNNDSTEFDGVVKLKRSLSEGPSKKSHSNWYDNVDTPDSTVSKNDMPAKPRTDSFEMLDWSAGSTPSPENLNLKRDPPPRTKKIRQTSRFYVNVDEKEEEQQEEQQQPVSSDTPSLPSMEDKETSPLRLDCSEKSVQTSLETLSVSRASRGEMSDDTDDLLDLAQTLQNELKNIITRHKDDKNQSGEDSADVSEHSGLVYDSGSEKKPSSSTMKVGLLPNSSTSSASEVWQMTSSDDSEVECPGGEGSNVSEAYQAKKKKKIFYIAQEIMTSERAFVDALKLLNVDFRAFVNEASKQKGTAVVPDDILNQILNHLPQLQHLNENLLMELEDRIEHWDKTNKIADVIVKMGPFLKLYSWYIQDFEATISLLEEAKKKHPLFGQVIKELELSSRCKRLSLNHYMLKPVQRIPQYRLLLQEYFHHLSEECEDYEQTKEALRIVSEVANHANESMKHGDNFHKLISIQNSILGHKEIIKPGRMFIKEGELMKLSRRGMQPRWFVLLNDMLLYLTQVQQGLYRVNHELMLAGMKVAIPIQPDDQNEFSIISVTRSFTLGAKSQEERQEWIVALTKAIEENASKRSTFTAVRLHENAQKTTEKIEEENFVLGRQAPVWIPDTRVTMCQLCTSDFTVTFRRHHCRACGKVVCSICSSNRISLPYLGNRIARVCDECHIKLGQGSSGCTESGETDSDNQQIAVKSHLRTDHWHNRKPKRNLPSVLKEVCANDQGSTISGYMYKRSNKNWKRNWFVVKDKVLYEYKASEDVAALRSIPLLGFQINTFSEPLEGIDSSLLIELTHPGQPPITFHAETPGAAERWIKALREATVLE